MTPSEAKLIVELRVEAASAGDLVQVIICDIALERESPVTEESWDSRYGGGGFDRGDRHTLLAVRSAEDAQRICAEVIADGAGAGG